MGQDLPGTPHEPESMQERNLRYAAPGPLHRRLMQLAGDYSTQTTLRVPGAPPSESSGLATLSPAVGGRFLLERNSGTQFGQAFEGLRLWGYNNATRKYEGCWMYSMSTAIMQLCGEDQGNMIVYSASFEDEDGRRQQFRVRTTISDNDHFTVELQSSDPNGPQLETVYTRVR